MDMSGIGVAADLERVATSDLFVLSRSARIAMRSHIECRLGTQSLCRIFPEHIDFLEYVWKVFFVFLASDHKHGWAIRKNENTSCVVSVDIGRSTQAFF